MTKKLLTALALTFAVGISAAEAATITAYEDIVDLSCNTTTLVGCNDGARTMQRLRQYGANPVQTENTLATIVADNALGTSFGVFDFNDFTYRHDLSWLSSSTFISATLTIWAYDVDGGNDNVRVGTTALDTSLGTLNNGNGTVTSTPFSTIQASISGNYLNLFIDKHPNGPSQDQVNVFRSLLTVTYDDGLGGAGLVSAPEPSSLLLLGAGLAAGARRLRRRKQ